MLSEVATGFCSFRDLYNHSKRAGVPQVHSKVVIDVTETLVCPVACRLPYDAELCLEAWCLNYGCVQYLQFVLGAGAHQSGPGTGQRHSLLLASMPCSPVDGFLLLALVPEVGKALFAI